jgi:ABC-type oligopeptide transport system substrate-binding subunit
MKKALIAAAACALVVGLAACAATSSHSSANMTYYHGKNIPSEFFRVVAHTATEITFEVRVKFRESQLYHLVLDGNMPLAEGWFPTIKDDQQSYQVTLKAKPGVEFAAGKLYRLCIGDQNPELVSVHSTNYRCTADYEFKLD